MIPVAALVPAAGQSGRMGSEKALLQLKDGTSFASYLIDSYTGFGCDPVVVVVHEKLRLTDVNPGPLITVVNKNPGRGRSWSIYLGLKQIQENAACFLHNIDNPFVERELLERMLEKLKPASFVVPVFQGRGGHPVLLGTEVVSFFRTSKKMIDFRDALRNFERLESEYNREEILWNINTPREYKKYILDC